MPKVNAPVRLMQSGEAITQFTDTASTTATTFTYPNQQEALNVTNKGVATITLTVNGTIYTIQPGQNQSVSAQLSAFTVSSASGTQQFDAMAWSYEKDDTQLGGNNVTSDGSVKTTMTTALSKDIDSVDVGKMSKGGATTAHNNISATATSIELNCTGFNSVIIHVSGITGTWDVSVQNATVSGGVFVDAYDDRGTQMKATGVTAPRSVMFRGVLDYVKIVATNVAAGNVTVKVVPLNV